MKQSRLARLARKSYAHCQRNGWSRDWREAGCYLHLEASEFTEALRGKGDFEQEAADVLFVLLSAMIDINHIEARSTQPKVKPRSKRGQRGRRW